MDINSIIAFILKQGTFIMAAIDLSFAITIFYLAVKFFREAGPTHRFRRIKMWFAINMIATILLLLLTFGGEHIHNFLMYLWIGTLLINIFAATLVSYSRLQEDKHSAILIIETLEKENPEWLSEILSQSSQQ